jgi:hypothetical protein
MHDKFQMTQCGQKKSDAASYPGTDALLRLTYNWSSGPDADPDAGPDAGHDE